MADVVVNLRPLNKLIRAVAQASGPMRKVFIQWGARYRGFVQERFVKFSRGGGDWKPLTKSTLRRRRKGKGRGVDAAILRDTNTLFAALDTEFTRAPGQLQENIPQGIRVGYGGPSRYPGGTATIADIASFHQEGKGRLPVRKMIVDPSQQVLNAMAKDAERALEKFYNEQ